jgi:hypothetical protein
MICKMLSTAKDKAWASGADEAGEEAVAWKDLAVGNYERYVDVLRHACGSAGFEAKKSECLAELESYRVALTGTPS